MSRDAVEGRGPLLLEPFLSALAVHGIRVGVRDYQRIATALAASGRWTLSQVRELLQALLAKDPEQARSPPAPGAVRIRPRRRRRAPPHPAGERPLRRRAAFFR